MDDTRQLPVFLPFSFFFTHNMPNKAVFITFVFLKTAHPAKTLFVSTTTPSITAAITITLLALNPFPLKAAYEFFNPITHARICVAS